VSTQAKTLILAGGGHSHVLVLKQWASAPLPDIDVVLISPAQQTPYSGMLPGLVAGHYQFDETHIDLVALAEKVGIKFIQASVVGIDTNTRNVITDQGQQLRADTLSIDCGSTPDLSVPGAKAHVIPVKPIAGFYQRWQAVNAQLQHSDKQHHIAIVGGGAAGVELALAMDYYWRHHGKPPVLPQLHLVQMGSGLPEGYPRRLQKIMARRFRDAGIEVHENFTVSAVQANALVGSSEQRLTVDDVFWCTQASAPEWPGASGIETNAAGFIRINDCLQSISHEWIFAAGDIGQSVNHPRPKAGVFAVRQGPILFDNLCRHLQGQALQTFQPQKRFLSLLACGEKYAVGTKYGITFHGHWVWRWKDRIDRRFMEQFDQL